MMDSPVNWAAMVPFVIPPNAFPTSTNSVRIGLGRLVQVAFVSSGADVTVTHNLGHPVQLFWAAQAPAGTYLPKLKISSTSNSAPNHQVILQSDTVSNPTVIVLF